MRAALEEARAEQEATDLEALVELEAEHGFDRILRVNLRGWKKA
jgi:thiamine pyrophosphokinase